MQRIVRPASALDREPILDVVEAAFVTEPAFGHVFGDAYDPHARELLAFLLELRMAGGIVWVEEADARIAAVSMWDPPGGSTVGLSEQEVLACGWRQVRACDRAAA